MLTLLYYAARLGFNNPLFPPFGTLCAGLFVLFLPIAARSMATHFGLVKTENSWVIWNGVFYILGVLILVAADYVAILFELIQTF
jgi:hypothetical protein